MILGGVSSSTTTTDGTQSAASEAKLEEDLNRFLTLLVTQLKNQDPLDPMDSTEFTNQLVQFASVEQQIFQNTNLEKLINLQESNQISTLVDYIGTNVEVTGQKGSLLNGRFEMTYDMPFGARSASLSITNKDGLTVLTRDAETDPGQHTFVWDGKNDFGVDQADGTYTVIVSALDADNNLLTVGHTVYGNVTGAGADQGNVTLTLGEDIVVPLDSVLSVKQPVTADP